jgi:hypothetical protein
VPCICYSIECVRVHCNAIQWNPWPCPQHSGHGNDACGKRSSNSACTVPHAGASITSELRPSLDLASDRMLHPPQGQTRRCNSRLNRDGGYELPGCWIATMKKLGGGAQTLFPPWGWGLGTRLALIAPALRPPHIYARASISHMRICISYIVWTAPRAWVRKRTAYGRL